MRMKEMVEYLEKQDFDVKMEWNRRTRLYDFEIARYGITVADNFQYPVFVEDWAREGEQKVFMTNLIRKWHAKAESNKNKKGESNMKSTKTLLYDLAQTTAGHLEIMGKKYPVMVREVTSTSSPTEVPETLLTCELVGRSANYIRQDIALTNYLAKQLHVPGRLPKIKDVIFNPPATIVFWADNTKTVVKCQEGDDFDPEKGLTMAITKKILGNKGNYYDEIDKWVKKYKPEPVELYVKNFSFGNLVFNHLPNGNLTISAVVEENNEPEKRWKIWWKRYNEDGEHIGSGVHCTDYACKSSAVRAGRRMFDSNPDIVWEVSQDNHWEKD